MQSVHMTENNTIANQNMFIQFINITIKHENQFDFVQNIHVLSNWLFIPGCGSTKLQLNQDEIGLFTIQNNDSL